MEDKSVWCAICNNITFEAIESAGPQGFPHHRTLAQLRSKAMTCPICFLINDAIRQHHHNPMDRTGWLPGGEAISDQYYPATANVRLSVSQTEPKSITIRWHDSFRDNNNHYGKEISNTQLDLSKYYGAHAVRGIKDRFNALSSSDGSFAVLKRWLSDCCGVDKSISPHDLCRRTSTFYPLRLIDVGSSFGDPHLVMTDTLEFAKSVSNSAPHRPRYIALSYCWGSQGNFTTSVATLEHRKENISMKALSPDGLLLPSTIKDAIIIARKLEVRYLWVDALCILQGSDPEATADWQIQSGQIGDIYGNAFLTVAAARANHVHEGIFHERTLPLRAAIPYGPSSTLPELILSSRSPSNRDRGSIFDEPLYKRAWALQERILSRRVVTFGTDQMTWQCRTCQETESGSSTPETTRSLTAFDSKTLGIIWPRIVTQYSHFATTRKTDKLPALSGLVKTIESGSQCSYIAGLWKHTICNDLLWRADSFGGLEPTADYRAPSWSWASLDGGIQNTPRQGDDFAQLLNYSVTPAGLDPAGELAEGWILMRGPFGRFPEFRADSKAFETISALEIFNDNGRMVGRAFLDTLRLPRSPPLLSNSPTKCFWREGVAVETFGLQTKLNAGIILTRNAGNERVYSRIGMFILHSHGQIWFGSMEEQTITII